MKIVFRTRIAKNLAFIKSGFTKELFLQLGPPGIGFDLKRFDGCVKGDRIHLEIKNFGFAQDWHGHISEDYTSAEEWYFVDEGEILPWPLSKWRHMHKVKAIDSETCEIIDDIYFQCAPAFLGPLIYPVLWSVFSIRPGRYRDYFKG